MTFFEPPPPPPPPEPFEAPEWMGAPENVIPGSFPLELVLARTDDVVRFGISLADGRKATVFDRVFPPASPEAVLRPGGGGGGASSWEFRFWAWPLPPEGPVAFVVEWPAEGIPLTRTETDSAPIREAAARAQELWPPEPQTGGWARYA